MFCLLQSGLGVVRFDKNSSTTLNVGFVASGVTNVSMTRNNSLFPTASEKKSNFSKWANWSIHNWCREQFFLSQLLLVLLLFQFHWHFGYLVTYAQTILVLMVIKMFNYYIYTTFKLIIIVYNIISPKMFLILPL